MKKMISDKFNHYHKNYSAEEDEKLVFLATSTIETLLNEMLKKKLVPPPSEVDNLFDSNRPLESFSSQINLAYRLGLISWGLCEELHLLKKIRKEFKNKIDCTTLDYVEVKNFCQNLKAPLSLKTRSEQIREDFQDTPRGNFELAVIVISCLLDEILEHTDRISKDPLY